MSRIFTALASPVARARVHECNLMAQEKRRLTAQFRAIIPAGVTIASAKWDMWVPGDVAFSAPQISGTASSVLIEAVREGGGAELRCQVTLSNGEVLSQYFCILIGVGPVFQDPVGSFGPTQLVVNA